MQVAIEHAPALPNHVEARRREIEQALLARVYGISDPAETGDNAYVAGFRAAVAAAVDFALETLATSPASGPQIPSVFLSQARLAARNGVRLDVVLRRYSAGHAILADFLIEELEREARLSRSQLGALLAASSAAFDRLLLCVGDEYRREIARNSPDSRDLSNVRLVERLLAGELADVERLDYPLEGWHVALVLEAREAGPSLTDLARQLDRRLLVVEPHPGVHWAWLGGRAKADAGGIVETLRRCRLEAKLAVGEAGFKIGGWRLSHQQATAVFPYAADAPVRYSEMGLLASVLKDQVLVESLRNLYLDPLTAEKDDGEAMRQTLRAYFEAECNVSSAAAALRVHRQTVTSRLRAAEERLGIPIPNCAVELNVALRLAAMEG